MDLSGVASELATAKADAKAWLFDALDLWAEAGFDRQHGGFHDRLTLELAPEDRPKRCRVQARQIYVFCEAGRLGWRGPWERLARDGIRFMLDRFRLDSGAFRFQVTREGAPLDRATDNYDQAFALFALAHARSALGDETLESDALACLEFLECDRANEAGGFFESSQRREPLLANPHMHLLEAAVEWRNIGSNRFERLGHDLVALATDRFIQAKTGALHESFDAHWRPLVSGDTAEIEPGHQFEWAWLLDRWEPGSLAHRTAIEGLYAAGCSGIDRERNLAVAALDLDGTISDTSTRLWPQTERLKGSLMMARRRSGPARALYEREAAQSWLGIRLFLDVPVRGLWVDRYLTDGSFVPEGAPASSLYHIVCGLSDLFSYAGVESASLAAAQ